MRAGVGGLVVLDCLALGRGNGVELFVNEDLGGDDWGRIPYRCELMPVAGQDNHADTQFALRIVHGLEDRRALAKKAAPRVGGAEAPVLREGHGAGDDFPVDVGRFRRRKVG